jgi:ABC-type transporter Mla subunit MlaD
VKRRRTAALAVAITTTAALTALTGCGALDKAVDCVKTADAIATSVDKLQQAVGNATDDPTQIDQALDDINTELGKLKDTTDNADLSKAVDDLTKGVDSVRTAVKNGDATPDLKPVTDAAGEIGKVCTPG